MCVWSTNWVYGCGVYLCVYSTTDVEWCLFFCKYARVCIFVCIYLCVCMWVRLCVMCVCMYFTSMRTETRMRDSDMSLTSSEKGNVSTRLSKYTSLHLGHCLIGVRIAKWQASCSYNKQVFVVNHVPILTRSIVLLRVWTIEQVDNTKHRTLYLFAQVRFPTRGEKSNNGS